MKIYFNQDGSIQTIKERDLLVATASGVNIIYAFAPFPSYSTATASFKRADSFTISELKMIKSLDDENCWYIPLEEDTGILNIAGELEITVRFYYDEKVSVMGIVTAHVYRSIGLNEDDEDDYYKYYVSKELIDQSLRLEKLEKEPPIAGGKPIHIGDEPPEDTSKIWLDTDLTGEDPIVEENAPMSLKTTLQTLYMPSYTYQTDDNTLPTLSAVDYSLPNMETKPIVDIINYSLPVVSTVDYNLPSLENKNSLPQMSEVDYNLPK